MVELFRPEDRDALRDRLIARANTDPRIVGAALVGSSAEGGDRWSDLDLTMAVAAGEDRDAVLEAWTSMLTADFAADVLFDLPHRASKYRVFLLPGLLQVDLSFTPAEAFERAGPRFRLLFGEARDSPPPQAASPEQAFGLAVHHAVRGHLCIERGRLWQAEYWIHSLRDEALTLACRARGLETSYGRGYDKLPGDVLQLAGGGLVRSTGRDDLRQALVWATRLLLREAPALVTVTSGLRKQLEGLAEASF